YYWTEGAQAHADYTAELARGLPPDVDLYWTGSIVRDHDITAAKAREAAALFGRTPIVWLNYASNDSFRFAMQLPPDRPPASDLAPETAGLLLNSTRQNGLARLDALVIGPYLADPQGYDHASTVHEAAVTLAGAQAAPSLERLMQAWRAVPDVRTLTHDLETGGRAFLSAVLARLGPLLATVDEGLPLLDAQLAGRGLFGELSAGVERLRLLAAALAVLDRELTAAGADALGPAPAEGPSPAAAVASGRADLLARLAAADAEAACDATAVLALAPGR
ncbi:MAG: beta-N-acetylglucosaminidase domain-containing protein, partial [Dehalococcoidia bacterium]|nr:beta-N-acetylglucosaminidase domain-containing protein [Dehalococcoidia bacterium]